MDPGSLPPNYVAPKNPFAGMHERHLNLEPRRQYLQNCIDRRLKEMEEIDIQMTVMGKCKLPAVQDPTKKSALEKLELRQSTVEWFLEVDRRRLEKVVKDMERSRGGTNTGEAVGH